MCCRFKYIPSFFLRVLKQTALVPWLKDRQTRPRQGQSDNSALRRRHKHDRLPPYQRLRGSLAQFAEEIKAGTGQAPSGVSRCHQSRLLASLMSHVSLHTSNHLTLSSCLPAHRSLSALYRPHLFEHSAMWRHSSAAYSQMQSRSSNTVFADHWRA